MLDKHHEKTGILPHALANKPIVPDHLVWVVGSFNALSRFRVWREGVPDPILFCDAVLCAELNELASPEQVLEFCELVASCDAAYITYFMSEAKRKMELAKAKNKRK